MPYGSEGSLLNLLSSIGQPTQAETVNTLLQQQATTPQQQSGLLGQLMTQGGLSAPQAKLALEPYAPQQTMPQKDLTAAQKDIIASHEKRIAQYRKPLETFNTATDLISNRGGFQKMRGQDDTQLITAFAQMQRPGEAMNEGDIKNILQGAGLFDILDSYTKMLEGKGRLSDPQRAQIYSTMQSMAGSLQSGYGQVRDVTQQMIDPYGEQLGGIMRPAMTSEAYPIPEGLLSTQPATAGTQQTSSGGITYTVK